MADDVAPPGAEVPDLSGFADISAMCRAFPRPPAVRFSYGLAGFRARAALLDSTLFRMGLLAALRAANRGAAVGLMVTASHNAEPDNGVKLVDPNGEMLDPSWESLANELANAPEDDVQGVVDRLQSSRLHPPGSPRVILAWDTRPSSERLAALAAKGVKLMCNVGVSLDVREVLTTPQLHHIVRMHNLCGPEDAWSGEEGYYAMLTEGYLSLLDAHIAANPSTRLPPRGRIYVDGACGVGALKARALGLVLGERGPALAVINGPGDGQLNDGCGAEFVQKARRPPRGLDDGSLLPANPWCCSLDGDGDRVVFHTFDSDGVWHVFDGDKIAALLALFCREHAVQALGDVGADLVSVVQTAYANGASTGFLAQAGLGLIRAKTGVKHLHEKAHGCHIGVYFEANGHGTVLFSESVVTDLQAVVASEDKSNVARASARALLAMRTLINQVCGGTTGRRPNVDGSSRRVPHGHCPLPSGKAVGDALSDVLAVEAVLRLRGWGMADWGTLYRDLPSRQTKIAVSDRHVRALGHHAEKQRREGPTP